MFLPKFPFFRIRLIDDRRSSGLLGRTIFEQDGRWLNKHGIICNTCVEMLLATATAAVLYSLRKSSLESSRRRASVCVAVGGMFANRYIFISQLLAQRVGPRVYIRRYVTPRRQKLRLSEQTKRPTRALTTARSFVFTAPFI